MFSPLVSEYLPILIFLGIALVVSGAAVGLSFVLAQQKPDGRWSTGAIGAREIGPSDFCDTAWAILFLKKASRPTQPIPAPVVTTGK